jgi:hypothetical protein
MTENTNTILDLGDMLNDTLDTIAEAPDFSNPPAGEYVIDCKDCAVDKYKTKEGEDKQRLKITYAVAETVSVAGDEPPVPNGSLFTETFTATEQGLSYFKKRIKEIMQADDVTGVTLGDMLSSVKGAQFKCRITIKKSPNPKGGEYENLQIRIIKDSVQ